MDNSIRIRYGRVKGQTENAERTKEGKLKKTSPKNTMVTMRDGDIIYFGIARCRIEVDTMSKDEGKRIAKFRADLAASHVAGAWKTDGTLAVHRSGVFGQVHKDEVLKLLKYFDNIDQIEYERSRSPEGLV